MRILALEGYYGGSHRAFLDGWVSRSRHDWTLLTLPPNKWKWRMRHGAFTLAGQVNARVAQGESWDAVFCSDMLNLAEFRGLVAESVRRLPTAVYFHENQLTYPVRVENERDFQYAVTNFTTALAADAVWFNSAFHRDEFFAALTALFNRMPDFNPHKQLDSIRAAAEVQPPGIEPFAERSSVRRPGPTRLLWAARWEHDKNPDDFFAAAERLDAEGVDFRLSVIGEQFRDAPEIFAQAKHRFAHRIDRWGYQPSRQDYAEALAEADIVVSTANHEFFGIGIVEAIAAGAYPLLPRRLAYPEILKPIETCEPNEFFYDGTVKHLARTLKTLILRTETGTLWQGSPHRGRKAVTPFFWTARAASLDAALERSRCKDDV
jgi:glycosyltransferase involved in cell wall biosynthesis